jgi:hypothetical protein
MRKTFLISIIILLLAGCNKDKFNTTPSLKYKSVNKNVIGRGQGDIVFTLSFTDKEGDLTDTITIIKVVPPCPDGRNSSFIAPYRLPDFPTGKNQSGDILVTFTYDDISAICVPRSDTAIFKFVLKDKAQHVSDTTVSEPIVIN